MLSIVKILLVTKKIMPICLLYSVSKWFTFASNSFYHHSVITY